MKGRELKPAAMRKRHNIAFRVRDELRERLQALADTNQRSVSEQIEHMLEAAFTYDDVRAVIREEMVASRGASVHFPGMEFGKPFDLSRVEIT